MRRSLASLLAVTLLGAAGAISFVGASIADDEPAMPESQFGEPASGGGEVGDMDAGAVPQSSSAEDQNSGAGESAEAPPPAPSEASTPQSKALNTTPEDGLDQQNGMRANKMVRALMVEHPNEDLTICVAGCYDERSRVIYMRPSEPKQKMVSKAEAEMPAEETAEAPKAVDQAKPAFVPTSAASPQLKGALDSGAPAAATQPPAAAPAAAPAPVPAGAP